MSRLALIGRLNTRTKLPPEPWQRAARVLHEAAEHGGPFVFMARINFYRAVYGETPPPIGNPEGKNSRSWARDR